MVIDPSALERREVYKLLTGAVVPQPIAWVSSTSPDGVHAGALKLTIFGLTTGRGTKRPEVSASGRLNVVELAGLEPAT